MNSTRATTSPNSFSWQEWISIYYSPVLQMREINDEVISNHSGQQLHHATLSQEKELLRPQDLVHNIDLPTSFWRASNEWIERIHSRGESE